MSIQRVRGVVRIPWEASFRSLYRRRGLYGAGVVGLLGAGCADVGVIELGTVRSLVPMGLCVSGAWPVPSIPINPTPHVCGVVGGLVVVGWQGRLGAD